MKTKSLVCGAAVIVALFASAHFVSACSVQVDVDLGCGFRSMTNCSGISVHDGGGEDGYDCADGYLANNAGGTITLEVDLPAGTFDISATPGPGDILGPPATVDINDGTSSISPTGIVGPTTVYVSFLNQGSAITRADAISISGDADPIPAQVDVDLSCGFRSMTNCSGISVHDGGGEDGYDCADGYLANNAGGTITLEVDLPCGTFDISATPGPGDILGPPATVDINDGTSSISPTGIVGPTTVYVSFLNQGSAITRADAISISKY